ncbi:MAG: helix-turn-helix transcriptional regulator [Coriobacteriia bacterium]|nr:helix-turn-helix transcriptional regulator [Coriobacteriia bacterium]
MGARKRLAINLSLIRKSRHVSQIKLAQICELDKNSIGYIEQLRTNPTLSTIEKLSHALKVDVSLLFSNNYTELEIGDLAFCFLTHDGMEFYPITDNFSDAVRFLMSFFQANNYSKDVLKERLKNLNIPYDYYIKKC